MHDLETALAIGEVGKQRGIGCGDNNITCVANRTIGVVELDQLWFLRLPQVNNSQTLRTGSHISKRPCDINTLCVSDRHEHVIYQAWLFRRRDINDAQSTRVSNEQVAELQRRRACIVQWYDRGELWCQRIVEVHNDDALVGCNVSVVASNNDVPGTREYVVRIPAHATLKAVVVQIAIGKRHDVGHKQAFNAVCRKCVVVNRVERLLLVRDAHQIAFIARWRHGLVGWQSDTGSELAVDDRVVPDFRKWCGYDALAKALVGDIRNVVDDESLLACRREQVFTAQLQATRLLVVVLVRCLQLAAVCNMLREVIGVGVALQVASDNSLRFLPFGDLCRNNTIFQSRIGMEADEVNEVRALQQ